MKTKKAVFLSVLSAIVAALLLDTFLIFGIALITEKDGPDYEGNFVTSAFTDKADAEMPELYLCNWNNNKDGSIDDVVSILNTCNFKKVGAVKAVIINMLRSKNNSVIRFGQSWDFNSGLKYAEYLESCEGTANDVQIVKIAGKYYAIMTYEYIDDMAESEDDYYNYKITTAVNVYELSGENDLSALDEYKTEINREIYSSASFYPTALKWFGYSLVGKILNIVIVAAELAGFYILFKKKIKL